MPGFLFYLAVLGFYPEIITKEVPAFYVLQKINNSFLLIAFLVVLFGTLIQTGTGFIHAFNERIQSALSARGKELRNWHRPLVAFTLILVSSGISTFGLINLVAKGYGSISWGIFFSYFIPLLTLGLYKIIKQ